MQPDQWPKYRYLLMEIWKPSNDALNKEMIKEIEFCRAQVFKSLYERHKKYISQKNNITDDDLQEEHLEAAFEQTYLDFSSFLKHFGRASEITKTSCKSFVHTPTSDVDENFEES